MRQARHTAGIDDSYLDYIGQREGYLRDIVRRCLARSLHERAYDALLDGKGGLVAEIRHRRDPKQADQPVLREARARLNEHLRHHAGDADASAVQEYLTAWRLSQPVGDRPQPPAPADLPAIQAALNESWAILDFWRTSEDEVAVFLITRHTFELRKFRFPTSDAKFSHHLDELTTAMHTMHTAGPLVALNYIGGYLFPEAFRKELKQRGIEGLYLVPHGYLHQLPLHAARFHNPARKQTTYLCEEFEVAYLPSASLLPQLSPMDCRGEIFSVGNPNRGTAHTLPFSDWEADRVKDRWGREGDRFFTGPEASYQATDHWSSAGLLHFTCHGYGHAKFGPMSRLQLADESLLVHDVIYRREPLREGALVLLNGCQTSLRDRRASDEGVGLMSAFLARGASLVMATQWSVSDPFAAEVILHFIEEVRDKGTRPTIALRNALAHGRNLSPAVLLPRCEELLKRFTPETHPHEAARLLIHCARAQWLLHPDFDRVPLLSRAVDLLQLRETKKKDGSGLTLADILADKHLWRTTNSTMGKPTGPMFDHPIYWAAFHLVGKVV
jgi:CHAT domain-containing protein